jgi:hypothetical protein
MSNLCKWCGKKNHNTANPYFRSDYTPFDYFRCSKCGRCWLKGAHHRHALSPTEAVGAALSVRRAAVSLRPHAGTHRRPS